MEFLIHSSYAMNWKHPKPNEARLIHSVSNELQLEVIQESRPPLQAH